MLPRPVQAQRPGRDVVRIVEAQRQLGRLEELLAEVLHLLLAVVAVEGDEVGQRPHGRVAQAAQVPGDVDLELDEQDGELFEEERERVRGINGVDDRCPQRGHHLKRLLGDRVERDVGEVVG